MRKQTTVFLSILHQSKAALVFAVILTLNEEKWKDPDGLHTATTFNPFRATTQLGAPHLDLEMWDLTLYAALISVPN